MQNMCRAYLIPLITSE